jgi:hypothetical protein
VETNPSIGTDIRQPLTVSDYEARIKRDGMLVNPHSRRIKVSIADIIDGMGLPDDCKHPAGSLNFGGICII